MRKHPFHLVDPSPWPLFSALAAFVSTVGGVMYMHAYTGGGLMLFFGISMIIYAMFVWWRDVVREATYEGHHTVPVQVGLRYGMLLFIVSEIMFFAAFFWSSVRYVLPLRCATHPRRRAAAMLSNSGTVRKYVSGNSETS